MLARLGTPAGTDIGRLDEDGYLFIEDRLKDLVIVGGYNVYPREIDEVIAACEDVGEAAAEAASPSARLATRLSTRRKGTRSLAAIWATPIRDKARLCSGASTVCLRR